MDEKFIHQLKKIVGEEYVSDSPTICEAYYSVSFGRTFEEICRRPDVVVLPGNAEEISKIVKLANDYMVPVVARGNATALTGPNIPLNSGVLLDMSRLNKVLRIDETRLVALVEAGCTVNAFFYELDKRGLAFPVRPWLDPHMFIGAYVSTNGDGDFSNYYGNVGENIVGLEVVLPTGEIVTLGSGAYTGGFGHYNRFVAGPDLVGLFVGAIGTMGIITKVAARLIPKRENIWYRTIGWPREKADMVSHALAKLFRYGVSGFHLHNRWAFKGLLDRGHLHCPPDVYFILNLMQVGPSAAQLQFAASDVLEICTDAQGLDMGEEFCKKCQGPPYYFTTAGSMSGRSSLGGGRATLRPGMENLCFYSDFPVDFFPTYWDIFEDVAERYGFKTADAGPILNIWGSPPCVLSSYSVIPFLQKDPSQRAKIKEAWRELAERMLAHGVNPHPIGALWPREALKKLGPAYDLIRRIKGILDPKNILNPNQL
jgi:glycolate oxidase